MVVMVRQESSAEGFAEKAPDWNVCPKCSTHYQERDCWYCGGDAKENDGSRICVNCRHLDSWSYCGLLKMNTTFERTCDRYERKVLECKEKTVGQENDDVHIEIMFWRAMREHQLLCERAQILSLAAEKIMKRAEALEPTINSGRKLFDIELGDTE